MARDPKRISPLIEKLRLLWSCYPDLRLCQLLINVAGQNDPFYVEDDQLEEKINEVLKEGFK